MNQDVRFHNQQLHGWGVVNGLQLRFCPKDESGPGGCGCRRPGECVALEAGYAIDPSGADIRLPQRISVPLGELVEAAGLARRDAAGTLSDVQVSVVLQRGGTVAVEKYEAGSTWDQLQGTLLRDLWDDRLSPLIAFFRQELLGGGADAQKHLTTALNLLVQLWNPRSGGAVFLDHSDAVLRSLLEKLRDLLSRKTFCGMYQGVTLPPYDVLKAGAGAGASAGGARPETIYGNALDGKLRVSPNGNLLYTFGSGNVIRVYDHDRRAMIQELAFPAADAVVQDLAFSRGGGTVYATALMGKDKVVSMFAVATVDGEGRHAFRPGAVTVTDAPWVTLETSANVEGKVFAVARGPADKGGGLYVIDPANVNPTPTAAVPFNAVGPFVVADREEGGAFAYACASSGTAATSAYDRVVRIDLKAPGSGAATYKLPSSGDDDLCVIRDDRAKLRALYVVVKSAQGPRQLVRLDDEDVDVPPRLVDLGENTAVRLAYSPLVQRVFVTYEDSYRGRVLDPSRDTLSADPHPLQIGPVGVRAAQRGERWVVLNYFSRTLTTIPARWTAPDGTPQVDDPAIDRARLAAYRAAALKAFLELLGRFLQYLKDSLLDRLLVDAPQDVGQQLYLGAVSFKAGKVHQVCGFDRRRHVQTFPAVAYRASLVPLLPLLRMALEKASAAALPPLFDAIEVPGQDREPALRTSTARAAYQTAAGVNLSALLAAQMAKWFPVKQVAAAWYGARAEQARVGPTANTASTDALLGTSVKEVEAKAEALGLVVVSARPLDPVADPLGALGAAVAPTRFRPGTAVELLTDAAGTVQYVRRVRGARADLAAVAALRRTQQELHDRAAAAEDRTSSLDGELEVMKLEALDREARITRLTNKLADVAGESDRRGREIAELRSTLNEQRKELARVTRDLAALRDRLR